MAALPPWCQLGSKTAVISDWPGHRRGRLGLNIHLLDDCVNVCVFVCVCALGEGCLCAGLECVGVFMQTGCVFVCRGDLR